MEGSSSKGSSKRKPAFTVKMTKKRVQSDSDEDDFSDAIPVKKGKGKSSDYSDDDSIPDLPEGTVIVKPEAVKEKKPRFSGPEFSKAPENLDIVSCTACGRQINPNVSGAAKRHPALKVLVCRKCYVYYRSGKIEQDEDGLDEQCRWCGEGGRLSGCDYCHNAFCKSCIIRNFTRAELTKIMADDDSKWKCYVCEPKSLKKLLKECDELFKKIEIEKIKAKNASSRREESSRPSRDSSKKGGPIKGQKSDAKSTSGNNKDLVSLSNISVSSTNFMDTVSQVLGLTAGFQTMLEVLRSGLTCGDVENSSRDLSRSAKTFETGLQQFLKQVVDIVNKANSKGKAENGDTEDDSIVSNGVVSISEDEDLNKQKSGRKSHDRKSYTPVRVKNDSSYYGKSGHQSKTDAVVEIKDSNSEDDGDDLPISFGPAGGSSSKADHEAMDVSIEEPKPVEKPSKPSLGETENEAAQLELLKELAEEMCKGQEERKEKAQKEDEEKAQKEDEEKAQKEDEEKTEEESPEDDTAAEAQMGKDEEEKEEPTKEAITSGESDSDDVSDDDDVSSSDLLMSSDGDVRSSQRKRRRKKETRSKESKKEKKKRKKKEKKERRRTEKVKKEKNEKKEKQKKEKKKKGGDSESEEDLDKLIDKFEEDPVMRKSRKKKKGSDSGEDEEKKETNPSKSAGEIKARGKKKKVESSSSDDDDDATIDNVDEEDEEEEENKTKLRNGKDKKLENGNDIGNEMAKAELMAELEDDVDDADADDNADDDDDDNDGSESDKKSKKDKSTKKGDEKSESKSKKEADDDDGDEDEDGEMDSGPSTRKRIRSKLLDAKLSESGSDSKQSKSKKKKKNDSDESDSEEFVIKKRSRKKKKDSSDYEDSDDDKKKKKGKKKKPKKGKKRKLGSGSESDLSSSSSSDADSEVSLDTSEEERREKLKAERKAKRKNKRRRIKQQDDSSDEDKKSDASSDDDHDDDDEDDDDDDENRSPDKSGRKNIRKIKSEKRLTNATRKARKVEDARRKRVEERQKEFNHVVQIEGDVKECPITTQLILEFDKETKEPVLEVNKKLVRKLKPHQVEACKFMWDCLCESVERMKKKEGSGCILAHCMGLGKTLSVISFVHTMLSNEKLTKMRTALIVCPLNTVINWRNEWTMWFAKKDQLDIYEISGVKQNWPRADYLKDWQDTGGIMIIGYEMYRNLTMGARIKNKKQKAIFQSTLVDPGPDLVVCDEGHILKNDSSAVSQALNKVKTRRRIVLTGTPLQNNLVEYHCMTSFVKPNLMGTRKEFLNRFVNPITNGQHSDSTAYDVKVMGRRAHVLHEMLAGCVQRRDYSALTKFLPPKFEYVISVRMTNKQMDLYQKYLDIGGINSENAQGSTKGARLFADYQNLMKIWTHPWVLKLAEIRAELKRTYDDSEDSFIDNTSSENEGSMSEGNSDDSDKSKSESEESQEAGPSSGQRRSRRGKPPPEDSDKDEVVKDWKTRSRGGDGDDDSLLSIDDGPKRVSNEWWADYVKEEDENDLSLGGKLMLLFEILRMCEDIGDKVLIFSQSLLSLNIIEYFLDYIDKQAQEEAHKKMMEERAKQDEKEMSEEKGDGDKKDGEKKDGDEKESDKDGEKKEGKEKDGEKKEGDEKAEELPEEFGKSWTKGADYFRMDGSTGPHLRSQWADHFNDPENYRARLFLISTRAGSLGINLVAANRVIIFDASWNPSHDVQSIFRVYRFGQTKPCYIYRFLAQGTMEEKIYERQVMKQSLSQRVVDEHQIDRHFTANDLSELYSFKPDRLDDPDREKVVHSLPKDVLLAELLKSQDTYIQKFHEHDSLLENRVDQVLSEEDKKAAWDEYENERKGISNRVAQASTASGMGMFSPDNVMQIVQMVKMRFPNLPPDMFQAQVQAILQQQILYQQSYQKQQIEQQRMMEMQRLHRIQQDIRSQQSQINSITRHQTPSPGASMTNNPRAPMTGRGVFSTSLRNMLTNKPEESKSRSSTPNKLPTVIDLSNS